MLWRGPIYRLDPRLLLHVWSHTVIPPLARFVVRIGIVCPILAPVLLEISVGCLLAQTASACHPTRDDFAQATLPPGSFVGMTRRYQLVLFLFNSRPERLHIVKLSISHVQANPIVR